MAQSPSRLPSLHRALVVVVGFFAINTVSTLGACATANSTAEADAARTRDEAACLKMCEVAGETSSTPEAITACQKDCTTGSR